MKNLLFILILMVVFWGCSSSKPELLNEDAFIEDPAFDTDSTVVNDTINIDQGQGELQLNKPPITKTIVIDLNEENNKINTDETKEEKKNKKNIGIKKIENNKEGEIFIQIGAFSSEDNAQKYYQKYADKLGVEIFINFDKNKKVYVLRSVNYKSEEAARKDLKRVKNIVKDAFIKK